MCPGIALLRAMIALKQATDAHDDDALRAAMADAAAVGADGCGRNAFTAMAEAELTRISEVRRVVSAMERCRMTQGRSTKLPDRPTAAGPVVGVWDHSTADAKPLLDAIRRCDGVCVDTPWGIAEMKLARLVAAARSALGMAASRECWRRIEKLLAAEPAVRADEEVGWFRAELQQKRSCEAALQDAVAGKDEARLRLQLAAVPELRIESWPAVADAVACVAWIEETRAQLVTALTTMDAAALGVAVGVADAGGYETAEVAQAREVLANLSRLLDELADAAASWHEPRLVAAIGEADGGIGPLVPIAMADGGRLVIGKYEQLDAAHDCLAWVRATRGLLREAVWAVDESALAAAIGACDARQPIAPDQPMHSELGQAREVLAVLTDVLSALADATSVHDGPGLEEGLRRARELHGPSGPMPFDSSRLLSRPAVVGAADALAAVDAVRSELRAAMASHDEAMLRAAEASFARLGRVKAEQPLTAEFKQARAGHMCVDVCTGMCSDLCADM